MEHWGNKSMNRNPQEVVLDERFGQRGTGIYFILVAFLLCLYGSYYLFLALLSEELLEFSSLRTTLIWFFLLVILLVTFELMANGLRSFIQGFSVIQRAKLGPDNKVLFITFFGQVEDVLDKDFGIYRCSKVRFQFLTRSLLSKDKENFKVALKSGRNLFISGDSSNASKLIKLLKIDESANQKLSH